MKQNRNESTVWSFEAMRKSVVFAILALSTMTGSLLAEEHERQEKSVSLLQQGIRGPRGKTGKDGAIGLQGNPEVRIKNLPSLFMYVDAGNLASLDARYGPLQWPVAALADQSIDASGNTYGGRSGALRTDSVRYRGELAYPATATNVLETSIAVDSSQPFPPLNNISLVDHDHLNEGYYTFTIWQFDPDLSAPPAFPERFSFMNEYIARAAGGVNPIIAQQVTGEEAELRLMYLHNLLNNQHVGLVNAYPTTTLANVNRDNRHGKTSKNCLQFIFYLSDSALAQIGP